MSAIHHSNDDVFQFLSRCSFLGGLPQSAISDLIRGGSRKRYAKGQTIFWRGEAGDSAMVVISGRLKVTNTSEDGHEVGLNFLAAGDIAGEIALLDGRERTANVVSLEESEVFEIRRRDLLPILLANPPVLLELVEALCQKLRLATAIIEDNSLNMSTRLAKGLLRLAQQHGRLRRDQIRIELPVSQTELGSYLGLSRANVSRLLARLKAADVIAFDSRKIVILDQEKLARLAAGIGKPAR